nr:RNA dependent RNA polymerase [Erysiphe necator associated abispo virus 1]
MVNGGLLNRGPHDPWRLGQRVQLRQNFVLRPQVKLEVNPQRSAFRDEQRALSRYQRETVLGPLFEDNHPVLTDGTFSSFLSAFNKRCNYLTELRADPYIVKSSIKLMKRMVPVPLPTVEWTKDLFDAWLPQFEPPKQRRLVKALDRFAAYTQNEFSTKDVFEKVELLLKRHDPEWAGRIVNASTDLHNALSGPIIAECLKRLVQSAKVDAAQGHKASVQIAYGEVPQTFVQCLEGEGPFIEADFSSNDKLQVKDVGQLESRWAVRLGMPPWLAGCILQANSYTAQSRKFGVRAKLKHQLPSGSTSTTFRNSIWNSTILFSWARRFGIHCKALVLGDDMLARITNGRIPRRARRDYEHFANLARMKAKVFVRSALDDCEFLSRVFVPTCHGHLMMPKLGKALGRFNARGNPNDISHQDYIAGKSLSYAYEFRHYKPFAQAFLERFLATESSYHSLSDRLLSYNFRQAIEIFGSRSAVLTHISDCASASDDEFCQFVWHRYGKFRTEACDDLHWLLFGNSDLPIDRADPYLRADVW